MKPRAGQQAFRFALIYVIVAGCWIVFANELLKPFAGNLNANLALNLIENGSLVIVTGGLLHLVLRHWLRKWELEMEQRQESEKNLRRTERALKTLSACNVTLVRATSESVLLSGICSLIVEKGGYRMAWVGFAENDESKSVRIVACAGGDDGYLEKSGITWSETHERGRGPTGTAVRTGQIIVCNDFLSDPKAAPWRDEATQRGYASSIVLPLPYEGKIFGVLTIYAAEINAFNPTEVELLRELAEDLAYGIHALRIRSERQQADAALFESEARYRNLFEHMNEGLACCRMIYEDGRPADFVHLAVNEMFTTLTGLREVTGKRVTEVIPGIRESDPELFEIYGRVAATGKSEKSEHYVEALQMWFDLSVYSPEQDCFVVAFDVITKRKQAEAALRESQALYHSLVTQLPIGIFQKDSQGRYVLANPGFCQLKGMKAEDFLGKTPLEVIANETTKQAPAGLASKYAAGGEDHHRLIMQTGKSIELDEEYLLADGTKHFVHTMKFPVFSADEKVVGSQGVLFNITDRKRIEQEMHLQSTALTAAANAIVITDRTGKIEWVNPAFSRLTGYSADEAVGHNPRILKSNQHPPRFYSNMWATINTGNFWHGELVNQRKDGQLYTEDMTITPVCGMDGEIAHFVAIKQDVTELRQLDNRLQQAQKMEAIGTLAGGIAHDFNNILAAMFGYSYLLQQDTEGNLPAQENIEEILKAAGRAKDLVNQILTFSRQREQKRQVIRLETVVTEAMKFLRASLPANIQIEKNLAVDVPAVLADPTQIYQIAINLATNALHAMEGRPGKLTVTLEAFGPDQPFIQSHPEFQRTQYARLSVADTGHGMDAKTLGRIFEPFFTTKPVGKGTGLGLALVHGIVQSHEGFITVESEVGHGTTFRLYFPAQTQAPTLTAATAGKIPRGHGQNILVVDDETALTRMFKKLLSQLNYQVTTSNSASEAVSLFRKNPTQFDLVITDFTMPEMNGLELARQLRAIRPDLPVILASGFTCPLNRESLHEAGICEVLEKPVSMASLADALQCIPVKS